MYNIFGIVQANKEEAIKKLKEMGGVIDFTNKGIVDEGDTMNTLTDKLNKLHDDEYIDLPIVLLSSNNDSCSVEEVSVVEVRVVELGEYKKEHLRFIAYHEFDERQNNSCEYCTDDECLYYSDLNLYEAIDNYYSNKKEKWHGYGK